MRGLIKVAGVLAMVAAVAAAGVLLGPKVLYALPPFQGWIKSQISKQSGGTFEFESIHGDLKKAVLGKAVLGFAAGKSNLVEVRMPELTATFELLPVFSFRLVLKEVDAPGAAVKLKLQGGEGDMVRYPVTGTGFSTRNATVVVENLHGYTLQMKGVEMEVQPVEGGKSGNFKAADGTLGEVRLSEIQCGFSVGGGRMAVPQLTAVLPGGTALRLAGAMSLVENQPIEQLDLEVNTPQAADLLKSLGYSGAFDGTARVVLKARGLHRPEIKNLEGTGTVSLEGISARVGLPNYPGLNEIGILKRARSITGLSGSGTFALGGNRIRVSALDLKNDWMALEGKADVGYDKSLQAEMVLKVAPSAETDIPAPVRGVFEKDPAGWTLIPFALGGTTGAPQVQVDSVITRALLNPVGAVNAAGDAVEGMGNAGSGLLKFFGLGGKKKEAPEGNGNATLAPGDGMQQ